MEFSRMRYSWIYSPMDDYLDK